MSTGTWKPIIPTPVVDADNVDAVITIPPSANTSYPCIQLTDIFASYTAAPSSARKLTIQSTTGGGSPTLVTLAVQYITTAGTSPITLENLVTNPKLGLVITLQASGTGGTKGSLGCTARAI